MTTVAVRAGMRRAAMLGLPDSMNRNWVNVTQSGIETFQDAIDALPSDGGTVYVPAQRYTRDTVPAVVPMTITKNVRLVGDIAGRVGQTGGSRVVYESASGVDAASDLITVNGINVRAILEDISFEGCHDSGAGRGLVIENSHACRVNNCTFEGFPSWAVDQGNSDMVNCIFDGVDLYNSRTNGLMRMGGNAGVAFFNKIKNCNFIPITGRALQVGKNVITVIRDSVLQTSMADDPLGGQELVYFDYPSVGTRKFVMDTVWLENVSGAVTPTSHLLGIKGPAANCQIENVFFTRASATTSLRALKVIQGAGGATDIAYQLMMSNCLGNKDSGSWVGTDDIVRAGSHMTLMNCSRAVGSTFDGPMRVSDPGAGLARLNDRNMIKLREISSSDIAGLTDLHGGEKIFVLDAASGDEFQGYVGGVWKKFTMHS